MKKNYETPEIEITMLDPNLDIISTSNEPTDPVGPPDNPNFGGGPGLNF